MGQNLVLECLLKSLHIAPIPLVSGTSLVGRSRNCEIHIPDPTISRRHAEILVQGQFVNIVDLSSRNGTFIEDIRIEASRAKLGQHLRFGEVPFCLTDSASSLTPESDAETGDARFNKGDSLIERVSPTRDTAVALSPAQKRVFDLLLTGCPEKEVAAKLDISQHTVHNHTREIYRTFGVHSRAELLAGLMK